MMPYFITVEGFYVPALLSEPNAPETSRRTCFFLVVQITFHLRNTALELMHLHLKKRECPI